LAACGFRGTGKHRLDLSVTLQLANPPNFEDDGAALGMRPITGNYSMAASSPNFGEGTHILALSRILIMAFPSGHHRKL
jgi:hypothetical protein